MKSADIKKIRKKMEKTLDDVTRILEIGNG